MEMEWRKFDDYLAHNLTLSQRAVYTYLVKNRDYKKGISRISQENIAKNIVIGISTVKRAIKVLVEKKFIIINKVKKQIGHFNEYKLLVIPTPNKKQNVANEVSEDISNVDITEELNEPVQAQVGNKNSELVKSKLGLKMTEKQAWGLNKYFTEKTILESITLAKRKKVETASLFIKICVERAFKNGTLTQYMMKIYKFTPSKIQNQNINTFSKTKPVKALKFANYDQRNVDYDSFEDELLNYGW